DGIRYGSVPGVQTCALPISIPTRCGATRQPCRISLPAYLGLILHGCRVAPHRVGMVRQRIPARSLASMGVLVAEKLANVAERPGIGGAWGRGRGWDGVGEGL